MRLRCGKGGSSLSESADGRKVPTDEALRGYLVGIGLTDEAKHREWQRLRTATEEAAKRFKPDRSFSSSSDLLAALRCLARDQDLPEEEFVRRLGKVGNETLRGALSGRAPTKEMVHDVLAGEGALDPDVLGYIVFCLGGLESHVRSWQTKASHVIRQQADRPVEEQAEPIDLRSGSLTASAPAPEDVDTSGRVVVNAESGIEQRPRLRWRRLLTAVATLVAAPLVVLGGGEPGGRDTPVPPTGVGGGYELTVLGQRVVIPWEPAIVRTDAVIRRQVSSRAAPPAQSDDRVVREYRRWVTDDGWDCEASAVIKEHRPPVPEGADCLAPGDVRIRVPDPSTDPLELRRQLLAEQGPGSTGTFRGIANLYKDHCLSHAQRAAVVKLLPQTPGVVYRGSWSDGEGRSGLAFSVDAGATDGTLNSRDTLVIDPRNGALLFHELTTSPESLSPVAETRTTYFGCSRSGGSG
ncbi:hypothetical protein ACQP2H_31520 [Micromonospora sp. CA-248260]|uniref:hypothetical protein n=1 Tax=Micromonospora sp. CA-248260 TaxID=3239962 RepID=UPI003D903DAE